MAKKLISFSLYGTEGIYMHGALRNAVLCPEFYPGWTVRLYVSQEITTTTTDALRATGAEVIRKERRDVSDGMFWRFLPASDPAVDALLVRDVDSRPGPREVCAVNEWLVSGQAFHIMRDHPLQTAPIPGGLWGCQAGAVPDMSRRIRRHCDFNMKGEDQLFLAREIYPRVRDDAWIHSSFVKFPGETVHPFPRERMGPHDFVGNVFDENDTANPRFAELLEEAQPVTLPLPASVGSFRETVRRRIRSLLNRVNGTMDCLTERSREIE